MKIAHFADLHIRNTSRHEEYRSVFKKVHDSVKNKKIELVVISGDIFHSKTVLSPESVQLASEFILGFGDIPVIAIAGNHDASLNSNQSRMDAITPIKELISNEKPNFFYYKDTGVYNYKHLKFFVYSCLDKKTIDEIHFEDESSTKILLYHGVIGGVKSYLGYEFSEEHQDKRIDFSRFDCGMLGDIHILGEPKPNHCYPSSLICQNYGEHPTKHGYLVWDIKQGESIKKPKYTTVENDWGYYTVYVNSDYSHSCKDFSSLNEIPIFANVRIIYETDCELIKVKDAISPYLKETQVIDFINKKTSSNVDDKNVSIKNEIIDLHDINAQEELFREYFKEEDSEILEKIIKLNREINTECIEKIEKKREKNFFKLKNIQFSNLFSFGEDNYVDFTNKHGIIANFSPNATGKTSFLNTIPFSIFGDFPLMKTNASVMNNFSDTLHSKVELQMNNSIYEIERTGKRNKKSVALALSLKEYLQDGTIVNHSEDVRDTQRKITDLFGDLDAYMKSSYMSQKGSPMFLDLTPSGRNEWFIKNLGIEFFDILNKRAKENSDDLRIELKKSKERDFVQEEATILDQRNILLGVIKEHESSLNELSENLRKKQNKREELLKKLINVPSIAPKDPTAEISEKLELLKKLKDFYEENFTEEKKKEFIENSLKNIKDQIQTINDEIENKKDNFNSETLSFQIDKEIEDVKDSLASEKEKYIKNKKQQTEQKPDSYENREESEKLCKYLDKLENEITSLKRDIQSINHNISKLEKNISILSEDERFENEKICKSCPLLENTWKEKQELETLRINIKNKEKELNEKVDEREIKTKLYGEWRLFKTLLDIEDDILKNREKLVSKRDNLLERRKILLQNEIDKHENEIKSLEKQKEILVSSIESVKETSKERFDNSKQLKYNEIEKSESHISILNENLNKYNDYLNSIKHNEKIEEEIDDLTTSYNNSVSSYKDVEEFLTNSKYQVKRYEENLDHLKKEKKWYEEQAKLFNIYDKYIVATSKNNIPYFVIKKIIKDLEISVNDILRTVVDFEVILEAENGNVECAMRSQEKGIWQSELLSGMETFMVNLAFRLGISEIANITQPNFLVVDEGFSALDVEHTQELPKLFNLLKSKLDFVLIVSHNQTVRDFVDHELSISRKDGKSFIST